MKITEYEILSVNFKKKKICLNEGLSFLFVVVSERLRICLSGKGIVSGEYFLRISTFVFFIVHMSLYLIWNLSSAASPPQENEIKTGI